MHHIRPCYPRAFRGKPRHRGIASYRLWLPLPYHKLPFPSCLHLRHHHFDSVVSIPRCLEWCCHGIIFLRPLIEVFQAPRGYRDDTRLPYFCVLSACPLCPSSAMLLARRPVSLLARVMALAITIHLLENGTIVHVSRLIATSRNEFFHRSTPGACDS